jgi:hypothetical protein
VSSDRHLAKRQVHVGTFLGQQGTKSESRFSTKAGDPYQEIRVLEELVHRPGGVFAHVVEDVGVAPEGHRRV